MSKIYTAADQLIGHTPLLELTHIEKEQELPIVNTWVSVLPVACLPNQTVGVTSPVGFKETTVPLIPCHCPS